MRANPTQLRQLKSPAQYQFYNCLCAIRERDFMADSARSRSLALSHPAIAFAFCCVPLSDAERPWLIAPPSLPRFDGQTGWLRVCALLADMKSKCLHMRSHSNMTDARVSSVFQRSINGTVPNCVHASHPSQHYSAHDYRYNTAPHTYECD